MLSDAIMEHKDSLTQLLDKTQCQIPTLENTIRGVQDVLQGLQTNYQRSEVHMREAFSELEKLILQRKENMLSDLEKTYEHKNETLTEQLKSLENTLASIKSCCEFTENALRHGNQTEILLVRKEMSEKMTQLCSEDFCQSPEENDHLVFNDNDIKNIKKHIKSAGSVQSNSAIAFETVACGEGLKRCYVNVPTTVNITTKDRNGSLIKVGHSSLSAEITASGGELFIPEIIDHRNGSYDLTYAVPEVGTYQLDICLYDKAIKGSPFKIKALKETDSLERHSSSKIPKTSAVKQRGTKRPSSSRSQGSTRKSNPVEDDLLCRVGTKGRNKGEFTNPQGIASFKTKILVADSNNQCIQIFTTKGDYKQKFGVRGRQTGQLQRPTGVAVTMNGNYLVADYDNKWVSVFSPEGKYLNKIGAGKLLGPKGVVVDNDGRIIVIDNKASCVYIFQSNGKLVHKFGSRGNEEHQFAGPHFCAISSTNDIVISDFHNHCVKVFDSQGVFKFSFGTNGEGNGQFNAPTGVAVDKTGNILVADWGNSRIQVWLIEILLKDNKALYLHN